MYLLEEEKKHCTKGPWHVKGPRMRSSRRDNDMFYSGALSQSESVNI